jgi:hypothetical protein
MYDLTDAGILTTASDLFSREAVRAISRRSTRAPVSCCGKQPRFGADHDGPITYEVEGRQYVSVICGNVMATFGL